MKYIVMQTWVDANGAIGTPVQNFDNQEDAYSRYYNILGNAVKSNYPLHGAIIMTEELFELEHKIFKHEVIPPTPEPELEPEQEENEPEEPSEEDEEEE